MCEPAVTYSAKTTVGSLVVGFHVPIPLDVSCATQILPLAESQNRPFHAQGAGMGSATQDTIISADFCYVTAARVSIDVNFARILPEGNGVVGARPVCPQLKRETARERGKANTRRNNF